MRAVAPEGGVDEALGETLSLRLSANENRDAENDAAQAENESALAMEKETQRDVERRRHSGVACAQALDHSLPNELARMQFVLVRNDDAIAFGNAVDHFRKLERAITDLDRAFLHNAV